MTLNPTGPAWLFCPADRPERYGKAAAAADMVIIDLEDAVAGPDKPAARTALAAAADGLDPARTVVRVNAAGTDDHAADLQLLAGTPITAVMLPKAETAAQVTALADYQVIGLIETPAGALAAPQIAAADNLAGMMWGAEDLIAGMGGTGSRGPDGGYRDVARHVRSRVLLSAAAHGRWALDAVHVDIGDLDGLRAEAEDAVGSGFTGTVCIHPSQAAVVRAAYRPGDEEVDRARRLLAAAEGEAGVFTFDGAMVDAPVLRHAEAVLRRAAAAEPGA